MFVWNVYRVCERCFKRNTLCVDVNRHSTVINLICDSKCRVIVIRSTDVPHIRRNFELTVHDMLRVRRPRVRDDINNPLISWRHFKNWKHFCKVILNSSDIHLIEDYRIDVFVIRRLIHCTEKLGFVELLCKFVEVTEKLCSVTPWRLNRCNDGRVVYKLTECICKWSFTCTWNTLKDNKSGRRKRSNKKSDKLNIVVKTKLWTSKESETLTELGKCDIVVINRRNIICPKLVDFRKLVETAFACVLFFAVVERLDFFACKLWNLVGVKTNLWNLHRENLILFKVESHNLFVECLNLFNKRICIFSSSVRTNKLFYSDDNKPYAKCKHSNQKHNGNNRNYPCEAAKLRGIGINNVYISGKIKGIAYSAK